MTAPSSLVCLESATRRTPHNRWPWLKKDHFKCLRRRRLACCAGPPTANVVDKFKILFICTGNACRSQMAEALLRHLAGDRFEPCSAGSHPAGFIHALAVECMDQMNVPMEGQHSKGWDEFANTPVTAVITLCDAAAAEACPVWAGGPIQAHWPLADPTSHPGSPEERLAMALRVAERLRTKIKSLAALEWSGDSAELRKGIEFLGEI